MKSHYSAVHGQYAGNGFKSVSITIPGSKKVQRFQICVGNHPDDIQRWIAERRKRFPRQSNQQPPEQPITATLTNSSSSNVNTSVKKESGLLGSLLDGYGSSSDDENNGNTATKTDIPSRDSGILSHNATSNSSVNLCHMLSNGENESMNQQQQQYRTRLCRYFAKNGQCRNGDTCSFSHDRTSVSHHEQQTNLDDQLPTKKQKVNHNSATSNSKSPNQSAKLPPPPTSLLRKLLANDIQREASLTLQLLEYLVRSSFLTQSDDATNAVD